MRKFCYIAFLLIFFLIPKKSHAWEDCPYGKINDPYPGSCSLYLDANNNRICDQSEEEPTGGGILGEKRNRVFWILFLTPTFYFLHWYIAAKTTFGEKCPWVGRFGFRYFWNLVLLLSFIQTAVLGLVTALGKGSLTLSSWHLYTGLVCVTVGFLHLLFRLNYFLVGLPKRKETTQDKI